VPLSVHTNQHARTCVGIVRRNTHTRVCLVQPGGMSLDTVHDAPTPVASKGAWQTQHTKPMPGFHHAFSSDDSEDDGSAVRGGGGGSDSGPSTGAPTAVPFVNLVAPGPIGALAHWHNQHQHMQMLAHQRMQMLSQTPTTFTLHGFSSGLTTALSVTASPAQFTPQGFSGGLIDTPPNGFSPGPMTALSMAASPAQFTPQGFSSGLIDAAPVRASRTRDHAFDRARRWRYHQEAKHQKNLDAIATSVERFEAEKGVTTAAARPPLLEGASPKRRRVLRLRARLAPPSDWPQKDLRVLGHATTVRSLKTQFKQERKDFASLRTAVSGDNVAPEAYTALARLLNTDMGWIQDQAEPRTRRGRLACNAAGPAASPMIGTLVLHGPTEWVTASAQSPDPRTALDQGRGDLMHPVCRLAAHVNRCAHGQDRPGRGALSDALSLHVWEGLAAVYYPNVELDLSNGKLLNQLRRRQNGVDLVRIARDRLVLAIADLPGLADILAAAESLELPSLGVNNTGAPVRLRVVFADLLRQYNTTRCSTRYFWHVDESDGDGIWYTMVIYIGKEAERGALDTNTGAATGVRVAGYEPAHYQRGGDFCIFPSLSYHKSEGILPPLGYDPKDPCCDAALGEYKLVLFLGPVCDGMPAVDWMDIGQ